MLAQLPLQVGPIPVQQNLPLQQPFPAPLPVIIAPIKPEPKGPRPVSSVPIPGTPWSVVWTSDDRKFFFNATDRVSVWTVPEDLEDSLHLDKILDNPPGGKSEHVIDRQQLKDVL